MKFSSSFEASEVDVVRDQINRIMHYMNIDETIKLKEAYKLLITLYKKDTTSIRDSISWNTTRTLMEYNIPIEVFDNLKVNLHKEDDLNIKDRMWLYPFVE